MRHLRWIRAGVALLVLALLCLGLLDFGRLPPSLTKAAGALQLLPSLLRLPATSGAVAVLAILLVTLLLGRVYCSTVCPLGTLQDIAIRVRDLGHRRGRYRFRFRKGHRLFHLSLAALLFLLALAGVLEALLLLEPFSAFGRIVSALVRPFFAILLNQVSRALFFAKVYSLAPVAVPHVPSGVYLFALASFLGLFLLAYFRGRLFCNLLCPAGAVLRLLSRRPLVRVGLDRERCNGCGACEKVCKAECIDSGAREIEHEACVLCFDCLTSCPKGGVTLVSGPFEAAQERDRLLARTGPDPLRRALITAAAAAPLALFARRALALPADPRDARLPIAPPGSLDRGRFTSRCTACQLCVAACPTGVLVPTLFGHGLPGLLEPRLDYAHGSCAPDCVRCGEVCPTGAIARLPVAEKHLTQIGRARFVKKDCVVEVKRKVCGACAEHCPTKAIQMRPYGAREERLRIPEVDEEACIGCGACEHPCPVLPRKAIWVEARYPHGRAKKIVEAPLEGPKEGDFPF